MPAAVGAIVLAAGAARRFGAQKLVAPVAGAPVVRWTVEHVLASRAQEVIVVLGRESDAVRAALAGLAVTCIVNPSWGDGLSTSLRAGLAALAPRTRAALVALGDQPTVSAAVCNRLIDAGELTRRPIVVPSYRGERGNPVLLATSLAAELRAVRGDRGARDVIARDPSRVAVVELDLPAPRDVDTAADLDAVAQELEAMHARLERRGDVDA